MGVSIGVNKIQRKIPMFAFDLQKCFARTNQGRFVNSLCQNIIESFEKEKNVSQILVKMQSCFQPAKNKNIYVLCLSGSQSGGS